MREGFVLSVIRLGDFLSLLSALGRILLTYLHIKQNTGLKSICNVLQRLVIFYL
jgi:hypothetical protein